MKNILLTGLPGSGKTTIVRRLVDIFKEFNPVGFYTLEIRREDERTGYAVIDMNGESRLLAHTDIKSRYAVGRYRIDLKGFDAFLDTVFAKDRKTGFYVIDEIGKMGCVSKNFCRRVTSLIESDRPFLGTISDKGSGMISDIKQRRDVRMIEITPANRELRLKELTMEIRDLLLK